MSYKIIQRKKIWLIFSGCLVITSIVFLILWGLNFGLDFTGGSLLEIKFSKERPALNTAQDALSDFNLKSLVIQHVGDQEMILRFQDVSIKEINKKIIQKFEDLQLQTDNSIEKDNQEQSTSTVSAVEELRFDSVGPSIGQELKRKSLYAIIIVLIAIVAYIAWAFRKVLIPIASWKYGVTAVIALFHDVIIVLGIFAFLGRFYGIEINAPFIAAVLTILGYSVNDTIVVFDRIRENLPHSDEDFENTINTSVNQTLTRSINTSMTTLLVLLSICFFGGSTIRDFALALSIGVFIGTYSSIFLASPILVIWESRK
ncbi:MAG: protein translocase subunit SecF [Patescibacteria group bacterium]|nr:protein translocase subunit SecF [Patescibacteria group bacterium]MBU1160562.1 protein translocase subunit SecF [Patescibacteria group bacterium]MBU1684189.1 protein translocase subunit SecF [Patescibacteria group bacterium]MBU1778293.1 protein translocase subunit SecF [Patescibacteria group bacterium]MBU1987291.1 protein translocase subunit SecF [Patescibacteria group bacterium]